MRTLLAKLVVALSLAGCAQNSWAQSDLEKDGKRLLEQACQECHTLRPITSTINGSSGWRDTVEKMIVNGAQLSNAETETVISYLSKYQGPGQTRMKTGRLPPNNALTSPGNETLTSDNLTLPPGVGSELIQGYCQMCHDLGRVVATRRTAAQWEAYTWAMLSKADVRASEDQIKAMISYLSTALGKIDVPHRPRS
jgi:mono/diheme cytochrome c family protein